jgi:uncharacterized membrane protein
MTSHLPHRRDRHPVNVALYTNESRGQRIADIVTGFMGSWRFIVLQTLIVIVWLTLNIWLLSQPFDPYPFILLNLAFSTQAAYATPLLLLASNRQQLRDRMTLEHASSEADIEEKQNEELLLGNRQILERVETLEKHILDLERTILGSISHVSPPAADEPTSEL